MATENPTPIRPPQDTTLDDIVQAQQIFMGLEATAKLLSLHVEMTDLDTDLVAYCMAMAREAERGYLLTGEVVEAMKP